MKQFLINSTSNLMSAAVIAGGLAIAPAPAEANDEVKNMLTAVIVGAIVKEASAIVLYPAAALPTPVVAPLPLVSEVIEVTVSDIVFLSGFIQGFAI